MHSNQEDPRLPRIRHILHHKTRLLAEAIPQEPHLRPVAMGIPDILEVVGMKM